MRRGATILLLLLVVTGALYAYFHFIAPSADQGSITLSPSRDTASTELSSREVDLFFADSSGRRLALERREVSGMGQEGILRAALEELVKGPSGDNRVRTVPETTQIRAVFVRDATVWVDLAGSIVEEHPGGAWTEILTAYSIINTLTENFSEVELVHIIVDGRERDTLAGHVDISAPLSGRVQLLAGEWE